MFEFKCNCGRSYITKGNLKRHQLSCNVEQKQYHEKKMLDIEKKMLDIEKNEINIEKNEINEKEIEKDEKEIEKEIKKEIEKDEKILKINNYYSPTVKHLLKLDIKTYKDSFDKYNITNLYTDIFQEIYFNKNIPQNHNILYSSMRSNDITVVENNKFIVKTLDSVQTRLQNKLDFIVTRLSEIINDKNLYKALNQEYLKKQKNPELLNNEFNIMKTIAFKNNKMIQESKEIYEKNNIIIEEEVLEIVNIHEIIKEIESNKIMKIISDSDDNSDDSYTSNISYTGPIHYTEPLKYED